MATPARPKSVAVAAAAGGLGYLVGLIYLVRPVGEEFRSRLFGTALFEPDNVLNLGILEWGWRSLRTDPGGFFDWPIGAPLRGVTAGTEFLLGWQPFYAILRVAGWGPTASFNLLVVSSFAVACAGACWLGRRLGLSPSASLISGVAFGFSPLLLGSMIQMQTLAVCWLPWALGTWDLVLEHRAWKSILGCIVIVSVLVLSSVYFAFFFPVLASAWSVGRGASQAIPWRALLSRQVALTSLGVGIVSAPILLRHYRFHEAYGLDRGLETSVVRALSVMDFTRVPDWLWLYEDTWMSASPGTGAAFPGWVPLALLPILVVRRRRLTERTRAALPVLWSLVALCIILSLGPVLKVHDYPTSVLGGIPLPGALLAMVPGFRMPHRWMLPGVLFLGLLAGAGFDCLRLSRPRLVAAILGALLLVESAPVGSLVRNSSVVLGPLDWSPGHRWLAATPSGVGTVVELPARDRSGAQNRLMARYVYASSGHGHPVVSYYGSRTIARLDSLFAAAATLPSPVGRSALVRSGVTHAVVHRAGYESEAWTRLNEAFEASGCRLVVRADSAFVADLRSCSAPDR